MADLVPRDERIVLAKDSYRDILDVAREAVRTTFGASFEERHPLVLAFLARNPVAAEQAGQAIRDALDGYGWARVGAAVIRELVEEEVARG